MRINRREFVAGLGTAGLAALQPVSLRASAPTAPVALARCKSYGTEFLAATEKMFDQLGGIGRMVKGKTVTIKINLTGGETTRLDYLPMGRTLLEPSAHRGRRHSPAGQGRRAPHSRGGGRLGVAGIARGIHAEGRVGSEPAAGGRSPGGTAQHQPALQRQQALHAAFRFRTAATCFRPTI